MVDIAQLKDLIVNGVGRFIGKVYASEFIGKLTGNADTATSATKATQDESGNNIKSSYASSISISDHTITLKNKNGSSLGTVTVPDNNTWRPLGTTADTACAGNDARLSNSRPASDVYAWAKASSKPSYTWDEITNKPSSFTPASHTHNYAGSSSAGGSANSLSYFQNTSSTNMGQDTCNSNAIGYVNDYSGSALTTNVKDGALYRQAYSTSWAHEIYGDYRTGQIAVRGKNNGTWQSWRRILDESNYKSYCTPANIGAAASSHTHSYAGSSYAGGSATSAVKLDSSAGSATQPVYFSSGKPVACTYTLGKSVPSDAVFTDTNTWRPVTDNLTSTSTSNCLSANQGKVLKELIDGKAASDHTHSNYLENGDYISCENSIVSIDGDLYVSGIVRIGLEESDVSCVKRITSGSKVTVTIPRNNLSFSTALLDDISIKCYVNGYGSTFVNIYNSGTAAVAASWDNSPLSSYCPTIGCSYTSTTATITLTAAFSTTKFLIIRYCPGLTNITVS